VTVEGPVDSTSDIPQEAVAAVAFVFEVGIAAAIR